MAVKTKDEILEALKGVIPDMTTDSAIGIVEDITDTFADRAEDWKTRYEENDRQWRERYTSRFFEERKDDKPPESEDEVEKTIDELFEERK